MTVAPRVGFKIGYGPAIEVVLSPAQVLSKTYFCGSVDFDSVPITVPAQDDPNIESRPAINIFPRPATAAESHPCPFSPSPAPVPIPVLAPVLFLRRDVCVFQDVILHLGRSNQVWNGALGGM